MRYFIDLFGCAKNQVDAENMMAHLNNAGWECAPAAETADLIIVNSCGFIESAKLESLTAVIEWRKLYPCKKILLAGCLAQRYGEELSKSLPEADDLFGINNISEIVKKVSDINFEQDKMTANVIPGKNVRDVVSKEKAVNSISSKKETAVNPMTTDANRPLLSLPGSACVKISEGCNNNCSYCAIPLIRGGLRSRNISDIVNECYTLLNRGIKELCIIGQDIGAFGTENSDKNPPSADSLSKLPDLLEAISSLKGNFWVRLLYIHPNHFPLKILDIIEKDSRFLPYFDIPFQHASPKILSAMNRNYNFITSGYFNDDANIKDSSIAEKYLELIKIIRQRFSYSVIRSTFLLGFPGETDDDFSALLDFQEKAALDWVGCFVYSREEGTTSFSMKNRVPSKIAFKRKQIIEERQVPITEKNMEHFIGKKTKLLIEEYIDGGNGINEKKIKNGEDNRESFWLGRLFCHAPDIDGSAVLAGSETGDKNLQLGTFIPCKIIARRGFDLEVELA